MVMSCYSLSTSIQPLRSGSWSTFESIQHTSFCENVHHKISGITQQSKWNQVWIIPRYFQHWRFWSHGVEVPKSNSRWNYWTNLGEWHSPKVWNSTEEWIVSTQRSTRSRDALAWIHSRTDNIILMVLVCWSSELPGLWHNSQGSDSRMLMTFISWSMSWLSETLVIM